MRRLAIIPLLLSLLLPACETGSVNPALTGEGTRGLPIFAGHIEEEDLGPLLEGRFTDADVPMAFRYGADERLGRIRAAGAGSRYHAQWSYRVTISGDEGIAGGLTEFNLNAQSTDRSMMRNVLASRIFRLAGFPQFNSAQTFFVLNNRNRGIYTVIERIDARFFERRALPVHELIKVGSGSRFTFRSANYPPKTFEKEIPKDDDFSNLRDFLYALDTTTADRVTIDLANYLDIENYLRYHALASVMKSSDNFNTNFYLYKSAPGVPYRAVPWDYDRMFDIDADLGFYGRNEIIEKLLADDSALALYKGQLQDVLENIFTEGNLFPMIDSLRVALAASYRLSPYLGELGYSLDHEAERLKEFIADRRRRLRDELPQFMPE